MTQATRTGQLTFAGYLDRAWREAALWTLVAAALYLVLSLATYVPRDPGWSQVGESLAVENLGGPFGAWFADLTLFLFGFFAYLIPVTLAWSGYLVFRQRVPEPETKLYWLVLRWVGFIMLLAAGSGLASTHLTNTDLPGIHPAGIDLTGFVPELPNGVGGGLGLLIAKESAAGFGATGGSFFLGALLFAGFTLFTGLSPVRMLEWLGAAVLGLARLPLRLVRALFGRGRRRAPDGADVGTDVGDAARFDANAAAMPLLRPGLVPAFAGDGFGADFGAGAGFGAASGAASGVGEPTARESADAASVFRARGRRFADDDPRPVDEAPQTDAPDLGPDLGPPPPGPADAPDVAPDVASDVAPFPRSEPTTGRAPDRLADDDEPSDPAAPTRRDDEPIAASDPDEVGDAPPRRGLLARLFAPLRDRWLARRAHADEADDDDDLFPAPLDDGRFPPPRSRRGQTLGNLAGDSNATAAAGPEAGLAAQRAAVLARTPARTPKPSPAQRTDAPPRPAERAGGAPAADPPVVIEPPPLDLLDPPRRSGRGASVEQMTTMGHDLEARLAEFGVSSQVVEIHPGPVVTLFELELAPGIKVSKITGLAKDIARALSKLSVRVVEVIPGKSSIGIEVPNEHREMVVLRQILAAPVYQDAKSPLTVAMGTNISGEPVVADLGRMPHALIAGTTGSGKSVAINAVILSLVYKAGPDDVRLIMVDPKMLELSVYEGIPHLLTPVVTDMKEAANALRWCVGEMERRYKLMSRLGVRNIAGYNRKVEDAIAAGEPLPDPLFNPIDGIDAAIPTLGKLPYIVVIIDELADMMMVVGKKVEELIARLAQKARASGIHLLLATQRPSVDVLTGLIKANIPTRIAFRVSARVDSRTVLDQMGAEHLLGHGDMLYLPGGGSIPQRVHGAFVDDHEVHKVVEHLKRQGPPQYIDTILQEPSEHLPGIDPEPRGGADVEDQDPLFDEAVAFVCDSRRASISGVQRKLKIGYNRAARMIEEMERIGIVGAAETNGNREVLAPPPLDD